MVHRGQVVQFVKAVNEVVCQRQGTQGSELLNTLQRAEVVLAEVQCLHSHNRVVWDKGGHLCFTGAARKLQYARAETLLCKVVQ